MGERVEGTPGRAWPDDYSTVLWTQVDDVPRRLPSLRPHPPVSGVLTFWIRYQGTFVSDNNIADGQVFPPGAEFVKSWIMRNDGEAAWPEETTLRYVAGHRMASHEGAVLAVSVGCVLPGAEAELFAGEMKVSIIYLVMRLGV